MLAVACTTIDNQPHAITGSDDNTVRVWNLALHRLVETIALPLPADAVAASGDDIIIGMRNEVVVLTRGVV